MIVAVVVAGGLTEILQATPLLGALVAAGETVVVATSPQGAVVAEGLTGVEVVVSIPGLADRGGARLPGAILALRRLRVDAALLCSSRHRDRVLVYVAGCSRRVGPTAGALDLLLTSRVTVDVGENRARLWLRMAAELGVRADGAAPAFQPPAAERQRAEALLLGGGFEDGRMLIAMAPGAGYGDGAEGFSPSDLRWDVERSAHLANQLTTRHGAGIVLLGGPEDRALTDELLLDLQTDPLDLVGQLTPLEAAAAVARCDLAVAGDTPVLHMAAALTTPSLGIFGPTDGRRRGPYGPDQHVVQAVAGRSPVASTLRLRVDDVLARIESSL